MDQSEVFLNGEGDSWFIRNQMLLNFNSSTSFDLEYITTILLPFKNQIDNILEIGCSSGNKLKQLSDSFSARGVGIDPSMLAIKEAKKLYQGRDDLNFDVGTARSLPYRKNSFDLVFFGFCLYLVPPDELIDSISEGLRVLRSNGFLVVYDFDAGKDLANPYKYKKGLFSFKRDYHDIVKKSSKAFLIGKHSFTHNSQSFSFDRDERVSVQIFTIEGAEA